MADLNAADMAAAEEVERLIDKEWRIHPEASREVVAKLAFVRLVRDRRSAGRTNVSWENSAPFASTPYVATHNVTVTYGGPVVSMYSLDGGLTWNQVRESIWATPPRSHDAVPHSPHTSQSA